MNATYMKEKPILPLLLSMAIPMVISMLVNSLYNIVDGIFVARMNEDAMMAISLVFPLQNLLHAIAVGFGVGTNAVIAIYLGASKKESANHAAVSGLLLGTLHGFVFMVFSLLLIRPFLDYFTDSAQVLTYGIEYAVIVFAFSAVQTIGITFEKIFQSVGLMMVSMAALGGGCLINIILDPILIFGLGPIPAMGIQGAAIATVIGETANLMIYLIACKVKPTGLTLSRHYIHFDRKMCRQLYEIGIPATLNMALPSVLIAALNGLLSTYSDVQVLILGIYYKLQSFLYLPANGIIQGMRPIMSYNYGAGETLRVKKIYRTALSIILLILLSGMFLCLFFPQTLIALFTSHTETITAGAQALRIICFGFAVSAFSVTSEGALEAMGKGVHSLIISCMRYVLLILPLAWGFSYLMGASHIWHAFWITELITALVAFRIFTRQYHRMQQSSH